MHLRIDSKKRIRIRGLPVSFINVLTSPALLALPVSVLILINLKLQFNPYILELMQDRSPVEEFKISSYHDIDNDGLSERLLAFNYRTNATLISYTNANVIYESWNLYGFWDREPAYDIYDIDNDGINELYALTITNTDSVFVNSIKLKQGKHTSERKFVSSVALYNGHRDLEMSSIGFTDITGDKIPEYIFSISAGFTLQPRAVYAWDIINDNIIRSPFAGMAIKMVDELISADMNNDGIEEVFLPNYAPGNYHHPVDYSDTAAYSLLLSKSLNFFYDPIAVAGAYSYSESFPMINEVDTSIITIAHDLRDISGFAKAYKIDIDGLLLDTIIYPDIILPAKFIYINNQIVYSTVEGSETIIGTIHTDFSNTELCRMPGQFSIVKKINLDLDQSEELILSDNNSNIITILQDNLKTYTTCMIDHAFIHINDLSIQKVSSKETNIHIQTGKYRDYLRYKKNHWYYFKYPIYLFGYLLTFLSLFLLQKVFIFRNNKKKEKENQIIDLQLQSVMNQLNPHFTFNAMNTIGDSILEGRKEEAYENFSKLSLLIRKSMTEAHKPDKSLEAEIEFVSEYLQIEKCRFDKKLTFEIEISKYVDTAIRIPKMLIHIFVENAIKHGIFHKRSNGHISIRVDKQNRTTIISICDNGIGREAAQKFNTEKGKGLHILDNYLSLFRESHNTAITYKLEDLDPALPNPGTRVTIRINQV